MDHNSDQNQYNYSGHNQQYDQNNFNPAFEFMMNFQKQFMNFDMNSGGLPPNPALFSMFPPQAPQESSGGMPYPFGFEQQYEESQEQPEFWHTDQPDPLTDYDIKMNEYILHIKPEKLLVYENHLMNVMQKKKTQIDLNLENLPANVHYTHILNFFEYYGVPIVQKQVYVKIRGYNKNKATINWYYNYELAWKIGKSILFANLK